MKSSVLLMPLFTLAAASALSAQAAKKPAPKPSVAKPAPKPPAPNTIKGQQQLAGVNGRFGTTYSLTNGFNITVLAARYAVESAPTPAQDYPEAEQKLLVIDFALKNTNPNDNWFGSDGLFTAVDQAGQLYEMGDGSVVLKSQGTKTSLNLRPAQGFGQDAKDPLQVVLRVGANARIVKIMLNRERLNTNEKTVRYYVAGATKAEAGADGDPKNVIAPLPDEVRDPADASGATALLEGKGVLGKAVTSRFLAITLDSVAFAAPGTKVEGNLPEEGKRFVVANITVSGPAVPNAANYLLPFDWPGGGNDGATAQLVDADGEKYARLTARKAKRDEPLADNQLKSGESYSYRVFWSIPKDAAPKKLILGATLGRNWAFDVSNVK